MISNTHPTSSLCPILTGPQPDRLFPCRIRGLCALLHALPPQGLYAIVRRVLLVGRRGRDGGEGVEPDEQVWGRP